jgi:excinuclease ABC subunit C
VGASRQRALLERFGSMRAVGAASEAEIAALPGFGLSLARKVLAHIRGDTPPVETQPG